MGFSHIKQTALLHWQRRKEVGSFKIDRCRWMNLNPCVHIAEAVQLHRCVLMCHLVPVLVNVVVAVQFLC